MTQNQTHELRFYKKHVMKLEPAHLKEVNFIEVKELRTKLKYGVDAIDFAKDGEHIAVATGSSRANLMDKGGIRIYKIGKSKVEQKHFHQIGYNDIITYRNMTFSQDSTKLLAHTLHYLEMYNVSFKR